MKRVLPFMLLIAGAGLVQASIVETIDFDLSPLNAGSILSGMFTLSNTPAVGDTAPVVLTFSDPSDYTPTSLTATITIQIGREINPFSVIFSDLMFTNLNGSTSPTDTKDVYLIPGVPIMLPFANFAMCASFPCTATGLFSDYNGTTIPVFTSTYTIAPVPEPSYAFAAPILLAAIFFGRRFVCPARTSRS